MAMKNESKQSLCYLRSHRLVWGLTGKELASLIGLKSSSHMSRIESSKRAPRIEVALACQVIFGVPPSVMIFSSSVRRKSSRCSVRTSVSSNSCRARSRAPSALNASVCAVSAFVYDSSARRAAQYFACARSGMPAGVLGGTGWLSELSLHHRDILEGVKILKAMFSKKR